MSTGVCQGTEWADRIRITHDLGDFLMEYVGEVMTTEQYRERVKTVYRETRHYHCLNLDGGLVIDGGLAGKTIGALVSATSRGGLTMVHSALWSLLVRR